MRELPSGMEDAFSYPCLSSGITKITGKISKIRTLAGVGKQRNDLYFILNTESYIDDLRIGLSPKIEITNSD
jgi:hypothetical protein